MSTKEHAWKTRAIACEANTPTGACVGTTISCDGAGGCKKDNGQSCSLGMEEAVS